MNLKYVTVHFSRFESCQIRNWIDRGFRNYFSARRFKYLRRDVRALILILNADPFATIRLPPLGFVDRGTRLRAQLMPPHAYKHSTYTRHTGYKGLERGVGRVEVARVKRHGGALGASNPIWISTADRAAH